MPLQGMFEKKVLPKLAIAPLAGAYVGYIVLNNLNLQINTVGFYQISKIAVAPAGKLPLAISPSDLFSVTYRQPDKAVLGISSQENAG